MKIQIFIALIAFFALTSGVFVPPRPGNRKHHLLGAKECTWGPSYWCKNLTSAAGCHATKHCIQTVWIHRQLPPDSSSVCQTCLDMVKQARDQLESNETQDLIKQVFEGTCALIHIKPIVKECDKIADNYIPDLIDTLASQMNPQIVCSVAGLCNNALLAAEAPPQSSAIADRPTVESVGKCDGCRTVVGLLEDKFNRMTRDEVLQKFLEMCGKTSSLADACSNIVITYFNEIYDHLKENFNRNEVCLLSGECSERFHNHANVEITPISHIGYVPVGQNDDLPCDLCRQLVQHLRDILVTNTTEEEFRKVLVGVCKQTRSFQKECLSIVDEYYSIAYKFLTSELQPTELCLLAGICTKNDTSMQEKPIPIMPLLPVETVKALEITQKPPNRINMALEGAEPVYQKAEDAQLPIDRYGFGKSDVYNAQTCVFCEYLLHYLQQVITNPKSEEEIKDALDKVCGKLPKSVNETCVGFISMYEPALVAILAQEVDPATVCPLMHACPSNQQDIEVFMHADSDGSECPMCLFAVTRLEEMVKDKKTEASIRSALNKLCSKLPSNLANECDDFVETYTNELVELLVADLTPQEICVYLKICTDNSPKVTAQQSTIFVGDVETNLIPDNTINGQEIVQPSLTADPQCVMCEFVMKEVQDQLKNNATDDEIENAVRGICKILPKSIKKQCNDFIDQYGQTVIQLLIEATVPEEICRMIHLCPNTFEDVKEILECAMCESVVYIMEKILSNPNVDHNVVHILEKTCKALPSRDEIKCIKMMEEYGARIYDLVIRLANKGLVCHEVGLCASKVARPSGDVILGAEKCTYGPGYWCMSIENASKCGKGATHHCREKVWGGDAPRN